MRCPSGGDIGPAGGGQVLPCPAPAALCRHPTCPLHPAQHQPCYHYLTFSVALSNAVFLTLSKCHHSASVGIFRQKPDLLTFVMHASNYPNGPQLSSSVQVQVGGGGKLENKSHFGLCFGRCYWLVLVVEDGGGVSVTCCLRCCRQVDNCREADS